MTEPTIDRFLIAAVADRLIYDDTNVFHLEDARTLLAAVPHRRSPRFEFGISGKYKGPGMRGFSPGVGSVNVKDDKPQNFQYSTSQDAYVRAGQWKLMWSSSRRGQAVEIEQVMADPTDEGRGARIRYGLTGEPIEMDIRFNRSFRLLFSPVVLVFPGWKPWKTPSGSPQR
ncbi:MAG: hypothetical protein EXR07_21050 [Acetobacteraceae bacterium]|nr:hypothetical protein [Acetobacteraceae bacterium]